MYEIDCDQSNEEKMGSILEERPCRVSSAEYLQQSIFSEEKTMGTTRLIDQIEALIG